jgi:3',5'-cyclic AMP phosphodiesterase CpdA
MPIHISRRKFVKGSLAAGVSLLSLREASAADSDPHFWALLADTHIAQDKARMNRGVNMTDNLRRVGEELRALKTPPAGVFINGDCALTAGLSGDYATLSELLKPLTEAKLPIHATLGNHDHRENFRAATLERNPNARLLQSKHVSVIESPKANWFLLDSLDQANVTPGKLGDEQREWLAKALDARANKPALVVLHHNPNSVVPNNVNGLTDTEELFKLLVPRKQVKAVIYGHIHHWNLQKQHDVHLIGLPPVAYVFQQGDPSGWVSAKLHDDGVTIELRSLDAKHSEHGKPMNLTWRTA